MFTFEKLFKIWCILLPAFKPDKLQHSAAFHDHIGILATFKVS